LMPHARISSNSTSGKIEQLRKERKPLKAKFQIGSVHGKINYKSDQSVFHKSDIPEKSRMAKQEVLKSIKMDILGTNKPKWASTTRKTSPICVRNHHQLLKHDPALSGFTYNYRAEVLPPKNAEIFQSSSKLQLDRSMLLKSRGEQLMRSVRPVVRSKEMPVNPTLEGMQSWNHASQITPKDRQAWAQNDARSQLRHNKRGSNSLKNYNNPESQYKSFLAKTRSMKLSMQERENNTNRRPESVPIPKKRYATTVSRKYKKYAHSGIWEFNKQFQKWMWSDTGSEVKDSKGDIVTIIDPDAYNFASPFS